MIEKKEDWLRTKWRPMMALTYMAINVYDFIIAPSVFNALQYASGQTLSMYTSITLQGGGLIHVADRKSVV
jgi:hypothetical protein